MVPDDRRVDDGSMTTTDTTTPPTNTDHTAVADGYFACWNATDPDERAAAIRSTWAPDARTIDPLIDATGHEQLAATFAAFHETYAGNSFRQRGGIDGHHDHLRWAWEMVDADGEIVLDGIDVALIDDAGLIRYLVGFFGATVPGN
jgi:hypothetical protein